MEARVWRIDNCVACKSFVGSPGTDADQLEFRTVKVGRDAQFDFSVGHGHGQTLHGPKFFRRKARIARHLDGHFPAGLRPHANGETDELLIVLPASDRPGNVVPRSPRFAQIDRYHLPVCRWPAILSHLKCGARSRFGLGYRPTHAALLCGKSGFQAHERDFQTVRPPRGGRWFRPPHRPRATRPVGHCTPADKRQGTIRWIEDVQPNVDSSATARENVARKSPKFPTSGG